jgi:uncharacterized membrane protein YhaH (DUF805 family)
MSFGLFSFEGRLSRSRFWYHQGAALALFLPYGVALTREHPLTPEVEATLALLSLAGIWMGLSAVVRRTHDRDKQAWYLLLGVVPVAGPLWLLTECGFFPGNKGPNRFGKPSE